MKEFDVYRIARRLGIKDVSNIEKIFNNLVIRSDERGDISFGYNLLLQILRQKITPEVSVNDLLADFTVGQKLVCKVLRQGKERIVNITLDEKTKLSSIH